MERRLLSAGPRPAVTGCYGEDGLRKRLLIEARRPRAGDWERVRVGRLHAGTGGSASPTRAIRYESPSGSCRTTDTVEDHAAELAPAGCGTMWGCRDRIDLVAWLAYRPELSSSSSL
jgi:hypothetical protein